MIDDGSMSNRTFKINELTRLIAAQLVLIDKKSAVNLACVSRRLEEPVLSTLWETQESFSRLLRVLPGGTWCPEPPWDRSVCGLGLQLEEFNT